MALSPKKIQYLTDKLISTTKEGYRPREKILAKIKEEKDEVYEAAKEYKEFPKTKHLNHLRIEFGDLLYAVCCLANSYGKTEEDKPQLKIQLDEAFENAPKDYQDRDARKANLDIAVEMLENTVRKYPQNMERITKRIGTVLFAIVDFVPVCCEKIHNIDLDHAFAKILLKNKQRIKEGYSKKAK